MTLAILCAGLVLGLITTWVLYWWTLTYIFDIPAPRDGLPGQEGGDNPVSPYHHWEV
jgi:hypothetical protein